MTGVNNLPLEVLGYIFMSAVVENLEPPSSRRLDERKYLRLFSGESSGHIAPFVFLQVCGHWRAVARATSSLWTSLDVSMHKDVTRTSTSIAVVEHWLSLSHPAPLKFVLETEKSMSASEARKELSSAHAAAVLPILANETHRWQSASFLQIGPHLMKVLVDTLLNQSNNASFLNLKQVAIDCRIRRPGPWDSPVEDLPRAIGSIKSLAELYISLHPDYIPLLLRDIPWGQLTTVHFDMLFTLGQVVSFLVNLKAAITAKFTIVTSREDDLNCDELHCTLPELKNLTLHGMPNMLRLLNQIHFPCLEQLDITSPALECGQFLQKLMGRPYLPIRRLVLRAYGQFPEPDLADCLRMQRLRQVPHVEIYGRNILESAAGAVARRRDDLPVLWFWKPPMQSLECVGWKTHFDHTDNEVTLITSAP